MPRESARDFLQRHGFFLYQIAESPPFEYSGIERSGGNGIVLPIMWQISTNGYQFGGMFIRRSSFTDPEYADNVIYATNQAIFRQFADHFVTVRHYIELRRGIRSICNIAQHICFILKMMIGEEATVPTFDTLCENFRQIAQGEMPIDMDDIVTNLRQLLSLIPTLFNNVAQS